MYVAEAAAAETRADAEIVDLRTLLPLDLEAIIESVRKTGRCVLVHEATLTSGFGAELLALTPLGSIWDASAIQAEASEP
jgi:2-oxoisovalerate dehydrogenase E1 component beta subunit